MPMSSGGPLDQETGKRIIALRGQIVANFSADNWNEVGLLTGQSQTINSYPRLLRSLTWNDEDYAGNVLGVLQQIAMRDFNAYSEIETYVNERFATGSEYISSEPAIRRITFAPNVFTVPDVHVEPDLVAVMIPFDASFAGAYYTIQTACQRAGLRCQKVSDVWESSVIIQDIFTLIFRAQTVVVDFTGKNANVMYETGIAHTLGKTVIPLSQSMADVPFDLRHHRVLEYLNNGEGLRAMESTLTARLQYVTQQH